MVVDPQTQPELSREDTPRCRFAVLCHQRSGSNALTSALQQHPQVELYGQLFNNSLEYRRHHRDMLSMRLFRRHADSLQHVGPNPSARKRIEDLALRSVRREHDVAPYVDTFFERFGADASAVGFKVHDLQLDDADLLDMTGRLDRVIVLRRRNLLRAAVSWAVAVQTDVWVRRRDRHTDPPPLQLDLDDIEWFIDKTQRSLDDWKRVLDRSDVESMWLEFETAVEAPDGVGPVLDFLGVDRDVELSFATKKLAAADYAHVANAYEIDRRLGNDDTGRLFGD